MNQTAYRIALKHISRRLESVTPITGCNVAILDEIQHYINAVILDSYAAEAGTPNSQPGAEEPGAIT